MVVKYYIDIELKYSNDRWYKDNHSSSFADDDDFCAVLLTCLT